MELAAIPLVLLGLGAVFSLAWVRINGETYWEEQRRRRGRTVENPRGQSRDEMYPGASRDSVNEVE